MKYQNLHFSQSLCSILSAAEGQVLGIGSKMFSIAGSVIIYGLTAALIYGVIFVIFKMF
ncbi:MAG: SpoVA/SpoVAEb family sporulation membrane protein [Acutalibacteraceae bacterium]|nr:SpoVA/SpoVAEb family sporulation membrane protein [Acutalibacteraceae bacterium]